MDTILSWFSAVAYYCVLLWHGWLLSAPEAAACCGGCRTPQEQYFYELSNVSVAGVVDFAYFAMVMKQICARVYLSSAPEV